MFEPLTDGTRHPNGWRCSMGVCGQYEARHHGVTWGTTHLLSIRRAEARLPMQSAARRNCLSHGGDRIIVGAPCP